MNKHNSKQWWNKIKVDPKAFNFWLQRQYHGEITAAARIEEYCTKSAPEEWKETLKVIADQERKHAGWIAFLLENRGLKAEKLDRVERYWEKTLPNATDFQKATAVAAHAEEMRLERIRTIAEDEQAPVDVRQIFQKIVGEEEFHAKAFAQMAGSDSLAQALEAHLTGQEAIGLISFSDV